MTRDHQNTPFVALQTPRAPGLGFRILCSNLTTDPQPWIERAKRHEPGPYIAESQKSSQISSQGSHRESEEWLIFVSPGSKVSSEQESTIRRLLKQFLDQQANSIVQDPSTWAKAERTLVVFNPELEKLADEIIRDASLSEILSETPLQAPTSNESEHSMPEPVASTVDNSTDNRRPEPPQQTEKRSSPILWIILGVILLVTVVAILSERREPIKPEENDTLQPIPTDQNENSPEDIQQVRLQKEWEAFKNSVLKFADFWNANEEALSLPNGNSLSEVIFRVKDRVSRDESLAFPKQSVLSNLYAELQTLQKGWKSLPDDKPQIQELKRSTGNLQEKLEDITALYESLNKGNP